MGKSSTTINGGIGFANLLTVLFVALKLCSVIDWSWWWVLSPLWLPWVIVFAVMAALGGLIGTAKIAVMVFGRLCARHRGQ